MPNIIQDLDPIIIKLRNMEIETLNENINYIRWKNIMSFIMYMRMKI